MATVLDDVLKQKFPEVCVRECPHPMIQKKYGKNGIVHVSWYCCTKCKFAVKYKYHGGISCSYGKEVKEDAQEGAENQTT